MRALLLALLASLPVVATAQEAAPMKELAILPRQIAVPEVANSMQLLSLTLDGVASESAWANAMPLTGFSPFSPDDEGEAGFAVNGRLLRTADALWVTVDVAIPESQLNRGLGPRDGFPSGDYVEIQLDPFATGLRAYSFIVNASGQLRDATVNDVASADPSWDSLFDAAVTVSPDHWTVEAKIPFSSLPHPTDGTSWRMNLFATSWNLQQTVVWSRIQRDLPNRLSQAGWVGGMQGLLTSGGLSLFPAVTLDASNEKGDLSLDGLEYRRTGLEADAGALRPSLGVLWQPKPQSRVEAVWNPDYSQVEADAGQLAVNNRFALFLEEKRPFFLEGQDLFTLPTQLIYTRSIGRPLYAVKGLTEWESGRAGVIAAYDVETARRRADGESLVLAERSQFDAGERNVVGQTLTYRQADPDEAGDEKSSNLVTGVDGSFYLLPTLRLKSDLSASHTEQAGLRRERADGAAANTTLSWEQKRFRLATQWQRNEEDFRADVGFVNRAGYQMVKAKLDGYYRSSEGRVSYASPGIWQQQYWDIDGNEVESVTGANTYLQTTDRSWLFATFTYNREREDQTGAWLETPVSEVAAGVEPTDWLSAEGGTRVGNTVLRDEELLGTNTAGETNPARVGFELSPYANAVVRPFPSMALTVDWQSRGLFDEAGGKELSQQHILRGKLQHWFHRTADFRYIYEWNRLTDYERNRLTDAKSSDASITFSQDLLFSYQPMPGTVFYSGLRFDGTPDDQTDQWSLFVKASLRLEAL